MKELLLEIGVGEATADLATRDGQTAIPVFGNQLRGIYFAEGHPPATHYAVPGWYGIVRVDPKGVLLSRNGETFLTSGVEVAAVLGANLSYVLGGMQP